MTASDEIIATLRATELFAGIDDADLAEIAGFCEILRIADGGELITSGSEGSRDIYLVVEGVFDVIAKHPTRAGEAMTLGNLTYEVVGEIAWLLGSGRTATIQCRGDMVAVRVNGPRLMVFLESHPRIGFEVIRRLMQSLSTKLVDANFFLM
ncbi:MAG TPA: cyclic nucleotide-binding domain-containing protein [Gammaproteobacteria bacterium]